MHDIDADLFDLEVQLGDRLLFCSDGASGVLDDGRLADVLSMGTPDYAAVELVRASLEAGTTDNVTCVVADVVDEDELPGEQQPMLVGAAADLKRRSHLPTMPHLFRGHRAGDTGELEPDPGRDPGRRGVRDRERPGRPRGGAVRPAAAAPLPVRPPAAGRASRCWAWSGSSAPRRTPGASSSSTSATTTAPSRSSAGSTPTCRASACRGPTRPPTSRLDRLSDYDASTVREGIDADSLDDAHEAVDRLAANQSIDDEAADDRPATATPSDTATPTGTDRRPRPPSTASATP